MKIAIFRINMNEDSHDCSILQECVTDWQEITSDEYTALQYWLNSLHSDYVLVEQLNEDNVKNTIAECLKEATKHAEQVKAMQKAMVIRQKTQKKQAEERKKVREAKKYQELKDKFEPSNVHSV
jgi:hypothetical protein